jgi:hypothetical protein
MPNKGAHAALVASACTLDLAYAFAFRARPHWAGAVVSVLYGMGAGALARMAAERWRP